MLRLLRRIEDERRIRARRAVGKRALGGAGFLAVLLIVGIPLLTNPLGWAMIIVLLIMGVVLTIGIITAPMGLTLL